MELSEFKQIMERIKSEKKVTFSKHADEKALKRGVNKDEVLRVLENLSSLLFVIEQEKSGSWTKYKLIFNKLSNYDLVLVISIDGNVINIITTYITNRKKTRALKKWLESQK